MPIKIQLSTSTRRGLQPIELKECKSTEDIAVAQAFVSTDEKAKAIEMLTELKTAWKFEGDIKATEFGKGKVCLTLRRLPEAGNTLDELLSAFK